VFDLFIFVNSLLIHCVSKSFWSPIHTADADATQLSSWVGSAVWTHLSAVVTQFTISCTVQPITVRLLGLVTSDDIMTSLLKKCCQYRSKFTIVKPLWSLFGQFPKLSTESVGSRRELVANSVHTAHAIQLDSWVVSAVCVGHDAVYKVINPFMWLWFTDIWPEEWPVTNRAASQWCGKEFNVCSIFLLSVEYIFCR